jgi:hypothetical protein
MMSTQLRLQDLASPTSKQQIDHDPTWRQSHQISIPDLESSVRFGYGLFQLVVQLAPARHASILRAIGFPVDAVAGMANLVRVAEDKTGLRSQLSAVVVGWVRVMEGGRGWDDRSSSSRIVDEEWQDRVQSAIELIRRCAGSGALPLYVTFFLEKRLGMIQEAVKTLDTAIDNCPTGLIPCPAALLLEKASMLTLM